MDGWLKSLLDFLALKKIKNKKIEGDSWNGLKTNFVNVESIFRIHFVSIFKRLGSILFYTGDVRRGLNLASLLHINHFTTASVLLS